jgi:hypothetical protein
MKPSIWGALLLCSGYTSDSLLHFWGYYPGLANFAVWLWRSIPNLKEDASDALDQTITDSPTTSLLRDT